MDPIQRNQAIFRKFDEEISQFIEGLSAASFQITQLVQTFKPIENNLHADILQLQKDLKKVVQDAIRIKHEVREL